MGWIIFLFCVAHDINSAVTCGANRLVFAAGKFSRYEFDCYKHSDINSLFSVPEFTRKETFVNLFDLMDECTVGNIIRRGNSEFNCDLGFRFARKNDQRQLAISFFSSQQKVAYNQDAMKQFDKPNLYFMYNPPSWKHMESFIEKVSPGIDFEEPGPCATEKISEDHTPFLWSSHNQNPQIPDIIPYASYSSSVVVPYTSNNNTSVDLKTLYTHYIPTQNSILLG